MNITIIGHNYYPEDSGIGLYTTGMAEYLAKTHSVNCITGVPYYPQWKLHKDYIDSSLFSKEVINTVTVYRFKQYIPYKPTFLNRMIQMIHFFFGTIFNIFKIKKTDVTLVVMPFTISIVLGLLLRKLRGGLLWIHIQDFEFDAAFKSGIFSRNKIASHLLFKIESKLLNKANFISTISQEMLRKLAQKTTTKQIFFPNWIDHSLIDPSIAKESKLLNPKTFAILYSGNIGEKQDWNFYIAFVKAMENCPDFHFYLVGEGAKRLDVVTELKDRVNFSYCPPVPYHQLNDLLCSADLHILFQKPDFKDLVMPSKILGMMASAKPSLVVGHEGSEIKTNFEQSNGGFYFHENNIESIKQKVIHLKAHPLEAKKMGVNARKFVVESFSFNTVLSEFQINLEAVCNQ
jgi:colanic acid biosynthesis glycosyl transferase WcaI